MEHNTVGGIKQTRNGFMYGSYIEVILKWDSVQTVIKNPPIWAGASFQLSWKTLRRDAVALLILRTKQTTCKHFYVTFPNVKEAVSLTICPGQLTKYFMDFVL